jgi:hypothetical protein
MILGLGTSIQKPCGSNCPIHAWNYLGVNVMHIAAYCQEFRFTNSAPEMIIINTQANTDPALDPGDMIDATMSDHTDPAL